MNTLVVVNPMSAGGRTGRSWPGIRQALSDAGVDFDYRLTAGSGEAVEITRDALGAGCRRVVAVGGDGTINEVLNGFFGPRGEPLAPDAALGIIPSGTGGDFRRTLGIPVDPAAASEVLARDHRRALDVGRIEYQGDHATPRLRHFINIADCGMGGELVARVNRGGKLAPGKLTFLYHTVTTMAGYRGRRLRVDVDEETREGLLSNVIIANGRYFGGAMLIAPQADPSDGLLDVIVLGMRPAWRGVVELRRVYRGTHLGHPGVEALRGSRVVVTPLDDRPALFDVEGEQIGQAPASITCLPGAVPVCVPPG